MATVQCSKCTAERKGFRRELDSWRCKLIHYVGFESILEGIYGSMLMRDLNLFDDCEPKEVDDWSPVASYSHCSFCNILLDKDQVPAATSPVSSPSEYSPCQAPSLSETSQAAHRFLQAVFHKKDLSLGCESNIPLIAQELMKKMIHQFAMEYASKCLLHINTNGVTTRTSSPLSETSDIPLDLTVSRTKEEKETEPEQDGVLDLSNRNFACSATSSSSDKASGCPPSSDVEDVGDSGRHQKKRHQNSSLDAVLGSLCPAHCSLLYQMLKLAHQEKHLSFLELRPHGQTESHCCHCGVHPQDNTTTRPIPYRECKAKTSNSFFPFTDHDHQSNSSAMYHPGDSKSDCSIHHLTLKDCKSGAPLGSNYCMQTYRMESCTIVCPKSIHCISCQSLAIDHNNLVCSFAPSSLCSSSSLGPSSSGCCNYHDHHSYPCYSNHACAAQVRKVVEKRVRDGDPPCPVLKREQSPSPPSLSPIPSDIDKKTDEKPPSLLHHTQEEEADLMVNEGLLKSSQQVPNNTPIKQELQCMPSNCRQVDHNPNGTLLQDVVNRFSEKLDTIRPLEKDPTFASTVITVSEKEQPQSPSTSQNMQFRADAHLTEIITTVLHTGKASDYNLSELFNRHESKEPRSPNTRARRRQEVLAAMATHPNDASTRRHSLQIKREFNAMFDPKYSKRKLPKAKRARLRYESMVSLPDSNLVQAETKGETDSAVSNQIVKAGSLNMLSTEDNINKVKEEITVIVTEKAKMIKLEEKERDISSEEKSATLSDTQTHAIELHNICCTQSPKEKSLDSPLIAPTQYDSFCEKEGKVGDALSDRNLTKASLDKSSHFGNICHKRAAKDCRNSLHFRNKKQKCSANHSIESRRSRRSIVPPQRFSSYVTEPRKMFFVACFSESIFNQKAQQDTVLKSATLNVLPKDSDAKDTQDISSTQAPLQSPFELTHKESFGSSTDQSPVLTRVDPVQEKIIKHTLGNRKDSSSSSSSTAKSNGRLHSSPKRLQVPKADSGVPALKSDTDVCVGSATCVETPPPSLFQYSSPIKLMFVSPLKDTEEIRYSLKSALPGSGAEGQNSFDPCEESSWSGIPEKKDSQTTGATQAKSVASPLKTATSTARSISSPAKSASKPTNLCPTPAKSVSTSPKSVSSPLKSGSNSARPATSPSKSSSPAKSASSSPKLGPRRSSEGTPSKHVNGSEGQRSPGDPLLHHETTPPKRRPGRPKKLGPQLEQKVKRPIGRPRKEKTVDAVMGKENVNGKSAVAYEIEENVNKNLKITVVYGRSRRNKRMVSESFDQLQTEFHDALQAVDLKSDFGTLTRNPRVSSSSIKTTSTDLMEFDFVSPGKESAPPTNSNIKGQKRHDTVPSRKPGRPAKVKISGISVTVTTVSPKQRKIQINKDSRPLHGKNQSCKKALLPEIRSAKETRTIICQSTSKNSQPEEGIDIQNEREDKLPNKPPAVRHSKRVRKPSIYFLHAIATSTGRSYSHSNALLRRSKQLLLNKASNEKKQEEQQTRLEGTEERLLCGQEKMNISQDIRQVAEVSVDSIFTPRETLHWWAASAEEKTMNQELARRIQLISDTWVSDTVENREEKELKSRPCPEVSFAKKSKQFSVVRTLFDCPPNRTRSCSMQQLCSWFMQTTETQSLAIVKKASSRNPYEIMHFPRAGSKNTVCHSPQAERLRKHIKKFAKSVPKSPYQHKQAQNRLRKKRVLLAAQNVKRQLFTPSFAVDGQNVGAKWWSGRSFGKYQTTLFRARTRFLTLGERERWQKRQRTKKNMKVATFSSNGNGVNELKPKALGRSVKNQLPKSLESNFATSCVGQSQEPVDASKQQNLCSKAWSPETLKECRVFLKKINSPASKLPEEEWDSCTVTLDDGSPSTYLFAGRKRELGVVKAVKRKSVNRTVGRELTGSAPESVIRQNETPTRRQKGKHKSPELVSAESPQPPPAKMLRQSRMKGFTGPRWCDFVLEN